MNESCPPVEVAQAMAKRLPLYVIVNARAFSRLTIDALEVLENALTVDDSLLAIPASRIEGWEDLVRTSWGRNAVAVLASSLDEQQLVARLRDFAATFAHPQLLAKQLSQAPAHIGNRPVR